MKVAIHQPHYFPWIGYFDKMAKVDKFVLLDEVQFEKGSQMIRNKVLDANGDMKYITISADTSNFLQKKYCELMVKDIDIWTKRQWNALNSYYFKATYKDEMLPVISKFLSNRYETLCEWVIASIVLIKEILQINTPLMKQSEIAYDKGQKKSELVSAICKAIGAETYFSGRGASVDYLDRESFADNHIEIEFQDFVHPEYVQCTAKEFVPGISILDIFFNCGMEETRRIFWENVRNPQST